MKKAIFLILCALCSIGAMAQKKSVTGVVTDASGESIIGASVVEVGTTNGVITDLDGKFSLSVSPNGKIQVSYVGYQTQTIDLKGKNFFNIKLKEDSEMLEEVVVMGYGGKQLRTKVTNSISKVKEETLLNGFHTNPAQALSGAVSGLRVQQTNGSPGATPTLVLRGGTNLDGSGSPLVVVDGQVRDNLGDINSEDIESMEVLKDAGATAIYGARANNGVVLVTTKRGKAGFSEIKFKAKVGVNYFNDVYNFLGGADYLHYMRNSYRQSSQVYQNSQGEWKGFINMTSLTGAQPYGTGNMYFDPKTGAVLDGNKDSRAVYSTMIYADNLAFLLDKGWKTMIDPVYGDKLIFKEFSLRDTNINNYAVTQDYNISFSGGNDKGSYYSNIGWNDSDGNAVGNNYKRLSFTFNADYKIREWLTSQSSLSFVDTKWRGIYNESVTNEADLADYFGRAASLPATFRGTNEDGEWLIGNRGLRDANYLAFQDKLVRDNNTDKYSLNQAFTVQLYDGLSLKVQGAWYINETKKEAFNRDFLAGVNNVNTQRASYASHDRYLNQTYNAVLNYDKQITKDHYLAAMAGMEYYDSYRKGFSASGRNAPTDEFMDLGLTSTDAGARSIDSWHERQRILSFFGRANYDYLSKYLVSFVIRRDGYSKLLGDNRWGVFPGVSAGWIFGKEKFMQNLQNVFSFAKIRASYGLNGNVSGIGAYDLQGKYGVYKYGGNIGNLIGYDDNGNITGLPNGGLRWEKSHTFEVGLDFGFLENKLNLNMTYYNRRTKDKLAPLTLPSHSGIGTFTTNNGEIQNQGLEFDLTARIINKGDWKWEAGLNGAYNRNRIITLPYNGLPNNRQGSIQVYSGKKLTDGTFEKIWVGGNQEGQQPGDVYAYKAEGIYQSESEILGSLIDQSLGNNGSDNKWLYGPEAWAKLTDEEKAKGLPIQAGDVKWKDVNGDNIIDQFDKVKVGNKIPKFTGGFNTMLSWKGLSVSARMDFALGFVVTDTRTPWHMGNMQGTYNTLDLVKEDAWRPDNTSGKYPMYSYADQLGKRNYARETSMFIYKGDYLAFREITLAYKVPTIWTKKALIQSAELSVTGQNLGYLTAAKTMYSPEYGANGQGGYSLPRSVIFGLSLSF